MGILKSGMTLCIGYYLIDILKKHKDTIEKIPFISDFLKKNKDKNISSETYILLFLLVIKDFIF